jgi:hypothetical protein
MSKKTIAKFSAFVILFAVLGLLNASCSKAISNEPAADAPERPLFQKPMVTGTIQSKDIIESSGIAASKCQNGVFWTHNDSGDDAYIFAIDEKGNDLGTWRVTNADNDDWEDIAEYKDASGKCFIYLGDIGDNKTKRKERTVYRVPEPAVTEKSHDTDIKDSLSTDPATALNFNYPDGNHNAETLMVNPQSGDIYVLTKRIDGPSSVYKLGGESGNSNVAVAQKVADLTVPNVPNGQLTGGDISPDGRRVVLCDYSWGYELQLPAGAKNFDEIWNTKPDRIDLGKLPQSEAIAYMSDGSTIIATSEKKHPPIVEVRRNQ